MRRRLLPYGLALASLAVLAWLVRGHLGELGRLDEVSPVGVGALAGLFLVGRVLGGVLTRIGLRALGHPVRLSTCVWLTLLASYTNLAVPRTGIAPGAVYLNRLHGVPYARYLSFAVASLLIATSLVGATGLVAVLARGDGAGLAARPGLAAVLAAIAAGAAAGVIAPTRLFARLPARWRTALTGAHDAWLTIARQRGVLPRIVGVQGVTIAVRALKVWVAFASVGVDVSVADAVLVSVCADVGMLISVTPAALGFREGGLLFGAALVGLSPGAALLAAVADRLATTTTTIVAGQIVLWRGLRDYWKVSGSRGGASAPAAPREPAPGAQHE